MVFFVIYAVCASGDICGNRCELAELSKCGRYVCKNATIRFAVLNLPNLVDGKKGVGNAANFLPTRLQIDLSMPLEH